MGITKEDAIRHLRNMRVFTGEPVSDFIEQIIELIERQPHVVLCEHCRYKRGYTANGNIVCNFDLQTHKSDWFCPRGKETAND